MMNKCNCGNDAINIIFDAAPGPVSGRFVEVETDDGKSINAGTWKERADGLWSLRIKGMPSKKLTELDHMKEVHRMATESLDPENFEKLVEALNQLAKKRGVEGWNEVF